jgi:hypothetical protein
MEFEIYLEDIQLFWRPLQNMQKQTFSMAVSFVY